MRLAWVCATASRRAYQDCTLEIFHLIGKAFPCRKSVVTDQQIQLALIAIFGAGDFIASPEFLSSIAIAKINISQMRAFIEKIACQQRHRIFKGGGEQG